MFFHEIIQPYYNNSFIDLYYCLDLQMAMLSSSLKVYVTNLRPPGSLIPNPLAQIQRGKIINNLEICKSLRTHFIIVVSP